MYRDKIDMVMGYRFEAFNYMTRANGFTRESREEGVQNALLAPWKCVTKREEREREREKMNIQIALFHFSRFLPASVIEIQFLLFFLSE